DGGDPRLLGAAEAAAVDPPPARAVGDRAPPGLSAGVAAGRGCRSAAMGVLTVHHWADRDRGLTEMRRVARRSVLFMRDLALACARRQGSHAARREAGSPWDTNVTRCAAPQG